MEHKEAKKVVANAASKKMDDLLEGFKHFGLFNSGHFKGVKKFHNDLQKDLDLAYKELLRTALCELIDEINGL